MNTDLLYHADSYLSNFDARVVACRENAIALDRTAFYPGGGGQMADQGVLRWDGQEYKITKLFKDQEGNGIWHEVEGAVPEVNTPVSGAIDWEFRYRMMRTHTALHILCGLIFKDFGAQVTGGQMYPDRARMDFTLEQFDQSTIREIEARANEAIKADHPIKVYVLPREEAFQIPDLIRTKINLLPPNIPSVRIVEIVGLDLQADGGTHVKSTAEVKGIKVIKSENKGKINKRLEIALVD
ncbi:MAG TPA: alanyl-tRNA editing protein [Ktedonobacterales bacterium]|nr:alanyl-tRNA editing protein [Ktedonobacterales bacterium]